MKKIILGMVMALMVVSLTAWKVDASDNVEQPQVQSTNECVLHENCDGLHQGVNGAGQNGCELHENCDGTHQGVNGDGQNGCERHENCNGNHERMNHHQGRRGNGRNCHQ